MVSVVLIGIWLALLVYQVYKWMFYRPKNFPPGKYNKEKETRREKKDQNSTLTFVKKIKKTARLQRSTKIANPWIVSISAANKL